MKVSRVPSASALELIRMRLSYDAETGAFRWRFSGPGCVRGNLAGYELYEGYRGVGLGGRKYRLGPIAWFLGYGTWPDGVVCYRDGDHGNLRLANLYLRL